MNVTKIKHVAAREFLATVSTRGFLIGLLLVPALIAFMSAVMPRLMAQRARPLQGEIAIVDETGRVAGEIQRALSRDAALARRAAGARSAEAALPEEARAAAAETVQRALGEPPALTTVEHSPPLSVDVERQWLLDRAAAPAHLAVVVIHADALSRDSSNGDYGGYAVYVPPNADNRIEGAIYEGVREALITARAGTQGVRVSDVQALLQVNRPRSITLSIDGQRPSELAFSRTVPFVFLGLMFMGVMVGGQGLLTTTIEEKSSRVVEVMLAAVSPMELLTGKLLGQLAVSLLTLAIYIGLGLAVLTSMAMLGLINLTLIVYLVLFFLVQYLLMGSAMIAVGSAVNEMREAQSLMMPVSLAMMLPWFFAAPILQNPSSTFATAISFIPPVNTFAMLLRLTSTAPPPAWQAWATAGVGFVAACVVMIGAAKIYRIGVLMYGKPPNLATLVRWVRAA